MITIANPVYDVVFKYLMEDERIARTILSALIKENIVYKGDPEMERIMQRQLSAATDVKIRRNMNIEDEFMSALERRETEILNRDYELAKQKVQINEQTAQIEEQTAQIEEQRHLLRQAIEVMREASLTTEEIARRLNIPVDKVNAMME